MKKWIILPAAILGLTMIAATPTFAQSADEERKGPMAKVDTNGDGVISMDEHLAVAKDRFGKIDTDGDGALSREEIRAGKENRRSAMKERRQNRDNNGGSQFRQGFTQ